MEASTNNPFSGIVLIAQQEKEIYFRSSGHKDQDHKVKIKKDDRFVVGSISKQFTAVMVLQQYEKGNLKLSDPISKYLSSIPQNWDTITIHQLLTHTHGIVRLEQALAFKPGSKFMYSQHGYELLAQILEKVTRKSFAEQSRILFQKCKMKSTCHPSFLKQADLVVCFTGQENGTLLTETKSLEGFPAAGCFISSASDLIKWNQLLFGGQLLNDSTLKLMTSPQKNAIRDHPVFSLTNYGYGITISKANGLEQVGQTGFADGFASMNFYFPATKTSVVVLENIAYDPGDLKKTFYYHTRILDYLRKDLEQDAIK
ncbi:MAG: serine hydrolase domain-containing protein [Bacteroidia bacterium]